MATKKKKTTPARKAKRSARRSARPKRQQPESLRLRQCSASFTVNDLPRSIAWYRDVLGFMAGERWEGNGVLQGIQMKAGSVDLMLTQDDFAKGRDRVKGIGVRLWCDTVQNIDRLAADITARGGTLTHGPQDLPWGDRALAVTDPDGFQITIVQA